jgi:shikimate dehydrogenase
MRDYDGINVTAPFKELAVRKADILSEECRQIGAANILIKTPDGIKAYNSDYLGVRQWLCEVVEGLNIGPTILIVGLGGAGKAAAEAARSLGFRTILMNRTRFSDEIRPLEEFCRCFREADIIIYNIPMVIPQVAELTEDDYRGTKVIIEANYKNPSFDKNMTDRMIAANPDVRYVSGETWLLYQALTGYEIFTGEKPDPVKMSEVISVSL